MWRGNRSLPAGQARCRDCRRAGRIQTCERCGQSFTPGHKGEAQRFCTVACGNQALGQARRLTPLTRPCKRCGEEFTVDTSNGRQACCSRSCVGLSQRKPESPSRRLASRIYVYDCGECGRPFLSRRRNKKLCSVDCQDKRQARRYYDNPKYRNAIIASNNARRAHKLGLGNAYINLAYLIERDGGRCRATVCHYRRRQVGPLGKRGPRMPSMDHIVPLSRGGQHELANVHLTHYRCNLSKGNRGGGEQLRLVG